MLDYDPHVFQPSCSSNGEWRTPDIAAWARGFRQQFFHVFRGINELNYVIPLNQGCIGDPRFKADQRKCGNPDANCPFGTDGLHTHWRYFPVGQVFSRSWLDMQWCWMWWKEHNHYHHPHATIEKHVIQRQREKEVCWWCKRTWPAVGVTNRSNMIQVLGDISLCRDCYVESWHDKKPKCLLPVPGVHIPSGHIFRCQDPACKKEDSTLPFQWLFEVDTGLLKC